MRADTKEVPAAKSRLVLMLLLAAMFVLADLSTGFAANVALQWDAVTVSGVTGYKVYYSADSPAAPFNGSGAAEGASPVDVQNLTTTTLTGLDPGKSYYFAVTAYDAAGNESDYSNIASILDLSPPAVAITSPTNGTGVSGTVAVAATANDNVGVTRVEFFVNGALQATDTAAPYLFSWDTSSLAPGSYTLSAKAYDAATNVTTSADVNVAVNNATPDTTVPTAAITTPTSNASISGTVSVAAAANDNVGVSRVDFYLNGTLRASVNTAPYNFSWDTRAETNDANVLSCRAYDAAGNVGISSSISVTVNNALPDIMTPVISSFTLPATATSLTVAISSLAAADNVGVTGYRVSENATAPVAGAVGWLASAPTSFTFATAGSRTAYVWAKDAAGNVSASRSAAVAITLPDVTAPLVSSFTLPATATNRTVAITSFTATDNIRVAGYLVSESSTTPAAGSAKWLASAPTSFTFAGSGSRTAYAWVKDAAGNISARRSATVSISRWKR